MRPPGDAGASRYRRAGRRALSAREQSRGRSWPSRPRCRSPVVRSVTYRDHRCRHRARAASARADGASSGGSRPRSTCCTGRVACAGRRTWASGRRRWRSARPRCCAPATARSGPTAATLTRWPAAHRPMPCCVSCSAATGGICAGKGGSMHITSVEHGYYGSYAIIGAHLPIACGLAWADQIRGDDAVTSASSATERRTSVPSTRPSTWPRCGRCRWCSCARTTTTWSTRRSPM